MKVLLFNEFSCIPGGIETVIKTELKYLSKTGIDLKCFFCYNNKILNKGFNGRLSAYYLSLRGKYLIKPIQNSIRIFNPDILHLHNYYPLFSRTPWDKIITGNTKTVLHLHNFNPFCLNSFFYNKQHCSKCLEVNSWINGMINRCYHDSYTKTFLSALIRSYPGKWLAQLNKVSVIIAVSEFLKQEYVKAGVPADQIKVLPNPLENLYVSENSKQDYVLYIGNIRYEKGIDLFYKAAVENPSINFIAAGDGTELNYYQSLASELNNLKLIGYVSGERKVELISKAAFICAPSRCYESFCLVILESFSQGKPVLSLGGGAVTELLKNNITGRITDEEHFSTTVKVFWEEIKINSKYYSNNCRKTAEKYSGERHAAELISIYKSL